MIDQKTLDSWYNHKSNKEQWIEDQELKELDACAYAQAQKEASEERNLEQSLEDRYF